MAPHHPITTVGMRPGDVPAEAARAARAAWQRLADQPADDRITLVADLAWQQGYPRGYRRAHRCVTTHLAAAAAARAGCGQPDPGGASLRRLATASAAAARRVPSPPTPPADRPTLAAAALAAADHDQPWMPVAAIGWAAGIRAGVLAGALGAATDVVIDWRARSHAGEAGIHQLPAGTWAADLLAAATRAAVLGPRADASGPLSTDRARAGQMPQPSDTTREVR